MTPSDSEPSTRARFELLLLPHMDALLAFARRRSPTEADAEDLVQETYVRAWEKIGDLREDGSARAWLFRILRRLLSDRHRADGRQTNGVDVARLERAHEDRIACTDPGPFEKLLSRLTTQSVRETLDRIPDEFAIAVALHDIGGFRYREIADILGVPLGTVMSRIHRGRSLLAESAASRDGNTRGRATQPGSTHPPQRA